MTSGLDAFSLSVVRGSAHVTYSGGEDGPFFVETDANMGTRKCRVRFSFAEMLEVRIGARADRGVSGEAVIVVVPDSVWVKERVQDYERRFGPDTMGVLSDVRHYVVAALDLVVGVLARGVECVEMAVPRRT